MKTNSNNKATIKLNVKRNWQVPTVERWTFLEDKEEVQGNVLPTKCGNWDRSRKFYLLVEELILFLGQKYFRIRLMFYTLGHFFLVAIFFYTHASKCAVCCSVALHLCEHAIVKRHPGFCVGLKGEPVGGPQSCSGFSPNPAYC